MKLCILLWDCYVTMLYHIPNVIPTSIVCLVDLVDYCLYNSFVHIIFITQLSSQHKPYAKTRKLSWKKCTFLLENMCEWFTVNLSVFTVNISVKKTQLRTCLIGTEVKLEYIFIVYMCAVRMVATNIVVIGDLKFGLYI